MHYFYLIFAHFYHDSLRLFLRIHVCMYHRKSLHKVFYILPALTSRNIAHVQTSKSCDPTARDRHIKFQ